MGLGVLFCRCFFATVHRFSYVYTPIIKASKLSRKNTTNQCGILTHPTAQKTTPTKKPPNVAHVIKARSSSRVGVAVRQARDWLYPAQQLNCVFYGLQNYLFSILTKLFGKLIYKRKHVEYWWFRVSFVKDSGKAWFINLKIVFYSVNYPFHVSD